MMTKKIDRLKQWTVEKLGQEQKTQESDEFKELEFEINMRYEGTERLHHSMSLYVRNLAKRRELDELEKASPIDILGQALAIYGDEFVPESTYGQALLRLGQANQRLAKTQEIFVDRIQRNFLEGIEKSIAQFKDFQSARKKLEYRRLAYDTALAKLQKSKRDDTRLDEEVRAQRIKYEETTDDVVRKMQAIRDAESECLTDIVDFFEAECEYYERSNEILLNLRKEWVTEYNINSSSGSTAPNTPKISRRARSTSIKSSAFSGDDSSPPPTSRRPSAKSEISTSSSTSKFSVSDLSTPVLTQASSISSGKFSAVLNPNPPRLNRSITEPPPLPAQPRMQTKKKMVKANFKYEAETDEELSIEPGDIIVVTEEIDPGWWIGDLVGSDGQSGMFPVPYCTVISEGSTSTNGGPAKPAKPSLSSTSSSSSIRRPSAFSALSIDSDSDDDTSATSTSSSFQSSMKKLNGNGGIVGSGRLTTAPGKKAPAPPPKRTGIIGGGGTISR
ncbi:uncharacterized protein V1516DRAFT_671456 [Lipomyces oligophaga]|uniref:uncharacterized protein n=1 Tax=Lipomyces oligophaga TaxID=45792 RepID=UPI0034CD2619